MIWLPSASMVSSLEANAPSDVCQIERTNRVKRNRKRVSYPLYLDDNRLADRAAKKERRFDDFPGLADAFQRSRSAES